MAGESCRPGSRASREVILFPAASGCQSKPNIPLEELRLLPTFCNRQCSLSQYIRLCMPLRIPSAGSPQNQKIFHSEALPVSCPCLSPLHQKSSTSWTILLCARSRCNLSLIYRTYLRQNVPQYSPEPFPFQSFYKYWRRWQMFLAGMVYVPMSESVTCVNTSKYFSKVLRQQLGLEITIPGHLRPVRENPIAMRWSS